MKTIYVKLFVLTLFAIPVGLLGAFTNVPPGVAAAASQTDVKATYKSKCAACHTPKATKFFDPAKSDEEHVAAIMKGVQAKKPPHMPAFAAKGITEDQAKALVEHMKSVRPAAKPAS